MDVKNLSIDGNAGEASVSTTNNYYNEYCKEQIKEIERKLKKKDKRLRKLTKLIKAKTNTLLNLELVVKNMLPTIYYHIIMQEQGKWQDANVVQHQLNLFEAVKQVPEL
ncbi:MAG: hypothetical protein PF445_09445 [Melioribacteraceae bacterium]|jgi:hypothetical protein|nr:hypothetical protein [Melioribacteraceae bacterium]